jgi:hypothetical protein
MTGEIQPMFPVDFHDEINAAENEMDMAEFDAQCRQLGYTRDHLIAHRQHMVAKHRRDAHRSAARADAIERASIRLGLIPEPPIWPGFERDGDLWVTREGTVKIWLVRHPGDVWSVDAPEFDECYGFSPRGAIKSLCASLEPGSPSRAAVAAILARVE